MIPMPDWFSLLIRLVSYAYCSLSTITHGEDYGSTTTYDVAASVDFLNRALHLLVYGNSVLSAEFQSFDALRNKMG